MHVVGGMAAALTTAQSLRCLVGIQLRPNVRVRCCRLRQRITGSQGEGGAQTSEQDRTSLVQWYIVSLAVCTTIPMTIPRHGRCYRILPSTQHDAVRHQISSLFPPLHDFPSLEFAT